MEQDHADRLTSEYGISANRITLLGTFDRNGGVMRLLIPLARAVWFYDRSYQLIRDCIIGYLDATDELK